MTAKNYLISAIVSVYNCERFIEGCLYDLEQQTIADKLEIVVVNSGSQQNEEPIIKKFQEKHDNIVYIKTENRETLYEAWNRGIKAASGKYITNANSDDRHRKDAFEMMIKVLEHENIIDVVYADSLMTEIENETFENNTSSGYLNWPEFDRYELLHSCFIGPQPMWRKRLHEEFGYFDGSLVVAGDYEFWLRIAERSKFKHIKEYLGLYLKASNSVEHRNPELHILEKDKIINKYMLRIAHNKKLVNQLKKSRSTEFYDLGYGYFKKNLFLSARGAFIRSIGYSWFNFKSYQGLIACCLSPGMFQALKKIKRIVIRYKPGN